MRWFNTAGPCDATDHYMLPASARLPSAKALIAKKAFFVLHAPRQTGKSTALIHLARELTAEGSYAALYFSCETAEAPGEDYEAAEKIVLDELFAAAALYLPTPLRPPPSPNASAGGRLKATLTAWSSACPRPLVVFFDEIDALRGQSLVTVLRQLRAGYPNRPNRFPQSVVLCGLRDVRDYKAASGGHPERLGTSSPFNIKVASIKLRDFTEPELRTLYAQHTADTGQIFTEEALQAAWRFSQGQPWLVNALAREVVDQQKVPLTEPITVDHLDRAKEDLILARATHLDSLVARLREPRVQRILEPLIAGDIIQGDSYHDDVHYLRDLGLLASTDPVQLANPIYKEVIVRVLNAIAQGQIVRDPRSYIDPDGTLNLSRILTEFLEFWAEHGDALQNGLLYHEVAAQLILLAYLQRVVNGGGFVDREYGVGRGRIDVLLRWPYHDADGQRHVQREAFEIKVWAPKRPDPLQRGLKQLDDYLDGLGLHTGVLAIFDRRELDQPIADRVSLEQALTPKGRTIILLRG